MAVYITKNTYFDTTKEIKINKVLPFAISRTSSGKNLKTIHLWLKP